MATIVNPEQFADILDKFTRGTEKAIIRGLQSAAYKLEGFIPDMIQDTTPYPPNDTGELSRSHYTTLTEDGAVVGVSAPHAPFMEYGTRPHFPPLEPLADWAYRKGMADSPEEAMDVALSIARKIAAHGIAPRLFLARSVIKLIHEGHIDAAIRDELEAL